jgi:PHD/YefM family antitoxin component YafN of YafNO toxin-antitoxin module
MPLTAEALSNVRYVVSERGEPEFVLLPCSDFRRLVETLEVEASPALMRSLERARRQTEKSRKLLTGEEVYGDL